MAHATPSSSTDKALSNASSTDHYCEPERYRSSSKLLKAQNDSESMTLRLPSRLSEYLSRFQSNGGSSCTATLTASLCFTAAFCGIAYRSYKRNLAQLLRAPESNSQEHRKMSPSTAGKLLKKKMPLSSAFQQLAASSRMTAFTKTISKKYENHDQRLPRWRQSLLFSSNRNALPDTTIASDDTKQTLDVDSEDEAEADAASYQDIKITDLFTKAELLKLFLYPAVIVSLALWAVWQCLKYACSIRDVNHFMKTIKWLVGSAPKPT